MPHKIELADSQNVNFRCIACAAKDGFVIIQALLKMSSELGVAANLPLLSKAREYVAGTCSHCGFTSLYDAEYCAKFFKITEIPHCEIKKD